MRRIVLILSCMLVTTMISGQNDTLQIRLGDETVLCRASDIRTITFDSVQMPRPLMGLQRWDMYSGEGATQRQELGYIEGEQAFLAPEEWHHRAPFFVRRTADVDWVEHPEGAGPLWFNWPYEFSRVQEATDQEIDFATDAGIDFFIFNGPARTIQSNGWGLHNNLDAYLLNTREDKVKFVCALYGKISMDYGRTKVDLMLDEAIAYMQLPEWQTVLNGRPLVPVLFPEAIKAQLEEHEDPEERMTGAEFIQHVRDRVMAAGLRNPYLVATLVPARSYEHAVEYQADGYDSYTDYAGSYGGAMVTFGNGPSFASSSDAMLTKWDASFVPTELDFVPPMSNGNYTWPRAEGDTHWIVEKPLPGDMKDLVKRTLQYVVDNSNDCEAQAIFSYSWNEHSEGGGICPTMGESPDYNPVTETLDEFALGLSEFEAEHTPPLAKAVMHVNKTSGYELEIPLSDLNEFFYEGYGYVNLVIYHDGTSTSKLMTDIERLESEGETGLNILMKAGGDPISYKINSIDSICFETPQTVVDPGELILKGDFNYFDAINVNISGELNDFDWRANPLGPDPDNSDWKSMNAGGGIQRSAFCKDHRSPQFLASNRLTLEEGESYHLSFGYHQHSTALNVEGVGIDVFLCSTQDKENIVDTLSKVDDFSISEWRYDSTEFQSTAEGNYYVVFSTFAPEDSIDVKLSVDNVSLKMVLPLYTIYLETTISAVQNVINAQSENIGYEAGEYTQALMDMATAALTTAQEVLENGTEQIQFDEAVTLLEQDMRKFVSNLLSTTTLRTVIDSAQIVLGAQSGNIGDNKGQYAQDVIDAALAAISAAEDMRDNAASQSEIDTALATLRTEMALFLPNATDDMDLIALLTAIDEAQAMIDTATVGNGIGEYSQEVTDLALSAILFAQNVLDTVTLQSVVDATLTTLLEDMAKFLPNTTGVDQRAHPGFNVYPNPVSEELFFTAIDPLSIKVTDNSGRILISRKIEGNRVDVGSLENGIYLIHFIMADQSGRTMKFIKL